jgi:hypothetical protein
MATIVALYRGASVDSARLIAVSVDPELVADVASRLLSGPIDDPTDPVLSAQRGGERRALRLIKAEAEEGPR